MQTLFHDSHEHIDGYSDPDLGLHCVLGGAIECFDSEMLLDPFEEQFDLPSALVQLCDGQSGHDEVVGQEDQAITCFDVVEFDSPDFVRVILGSIEAGEDAGLITYQPACTIDFMGIHSTEPGITLGTDDEEGLREVDLIEPGVIKITTIHDVERTCFREQVIEDVDVMDLTVSDKGKRWDTSSQIKQGVEFDCRFRLAEVCPGEKRQAQVDGSGVKRIDSLLQLQAEVVFSIETPCLGYQNLGELGIDAPVPFFIGFSQGASSDISPNAHMIPSRRNSSQTGFDISQAFTIGQLSEGHAEVLVPAGESLDVFVPIVSLNTSSEVVYGKKIHELCKDDSSGIHRPPPTRCPAEYGRLSYEISNR
jgi:hypothetical protein